MKTTSQREVNGRFQKPFSFFEMKCMNDKLLIFGLGSLKPRVELYRFCITTACLGIPLFFRYLDYPEWTYVAMVDFNKNKVDSKTLQYNKPPQMEIMGINVNEKRNEVYMLLVDSKTKRKTYQYLQTVKLNNKIEIGSKVKLKIGKKDELVAQSAKVNSITEESQIIVGRYISKKHIKFFVNEMKLNKGIYISKINKNKLEWSSNFTYDQIFKKKPNQRFTSGQSGEAEVLDEVNMNFDFHDMVELNDKYIFSGEMYITLYDIVEVRNAQGGYTSHRRFAGYYYEKCIAFALNKKGELLWSSWFNLPYFRLMEKPTKPLLKQEFDEDEIRLTGYVKNTLVTHTINHNGFIEHNIETQIVEKENVNFRKYLQVLKYDYWYDEYFITSSIEWARFNADEHSHLKHWHKKVIFHKMKYKTN